MCVVMRCSKLLAIAASIVCFYDQNANMGPVWSFRFRGPGHSWCSVQITYDTIRYDSVYLTCSKQPTGSQLSPPHGTNKKIKCETKNKTMSMIGPVQSRCHEGSPVGKRSLRWEGFVAMVGFEPGVKE